MNHSRLIFGLVTLIVCVCLFSGSLISGIQTSCGQDTFSESVRSTDPLSPAEEAATFTLPSGFKIELFASEPDILKPLNMAFDDRGRLWVSQTIEYPYPVALNERGRDSIRILEDTDGDGRADRFTTFADGLNIPMGLYPFRDACIAFSIPHIWKFEDLDGDGVSDQRSKLYGPFGWQRDTHGLNNAFRRGFDGWLYACHGFNNESVVAGLDGHEVAMQSGNTYRMQIDGSRIEQYTWGQVNPFGMTLDSLGNFFTADCHSKPVYQLLREGYYPSFGKPHGGLGFVPPMMDHLHGSTAIAGVAFISHRFPADFAGDLISGNVMTSRINRNSLTYSGSTVRATERPDLLQTTDPWFRPVDIRIGPDDAIYVADFYNRIIGHYEVPLDHPGRDRHRGRIWRISYDDVEKQPSESVQTAGEESLPQLFEALGDPNLEKRLTTLNRLIDSADDALKTPTLDMAESTFSQSQNTAQMVASLWIVARLQGNLDAILSRAATHADRELRVHAMKVLSETQNWNDAMRQLAFQGLSDEDAFVVKAAADAIGQHPSPESLRPLLGAITNADPADHQLNYTARNSIKNSLSLPNAFQDLAWERLSPRELELIASISLAIPTPDASAFLLDFIRSVADHPMPQTNQYLLHMTRYLPEERIHLLIDEIQSRFNSDLDVQLTLINTMLQAMQERAEDPAQRLRDWGLELAGTILDQSKPRDFDWYHLTRSNPENSVNPWTVQERTSEDGQPGRFLSTLASGEQATGILHSTPFITPDQIVFFMAGHDGVPGAAPKHANQVRLRNLATHQVLREELAPRHDVARRFNWDLSDIKGDEVYLEIVDADADRAYAWIAVGRFLPRSINIPDLSPRHRTVRLESAAKLCHQLRLTELTPKLIDLLNLSRIEASVRHAVCTALADLSDDDLARSIATVVGTGLVDQRIERDIVSFLQGASVDTVEETIGSIFGSLPSQRQLQFALALASSRPGSEILLKLIRDGKASPRLLTSSPLVGMLQTQKIVNLATTIDELTVDLKPADMAINERIASSINSYRKSKGESAKGVEIFREKCANCHQIGGQGAIVGPQLDGIGLRGLDRLAEDTLDPNRNVDVAFRTSLISTVDGRVISGLPRSETEASLELVDNLGKSVLINKADIEQRRSTQWSLMPEDIGSALTDEQFRHLLAYLLDQRAVESEPLPADE